MKLTEVIDAKLGGRAWIAGTEPTLADIALCRYIARAPEANLDLSASPPTTDMVQGGCADDGGTPDLKRGSRMESTQPDRPPAPWHEGELTIQRSIGVAERMDDIGRRFIRDHLLDQHSEFYRQLPFVVLGAVAPDGEVWATVRGGRPGFLATVDIHRLHIAVPRDPADPADRGMEHGQAIGLLGIDLGNRRRNRLNGTIDRDGAAQGFDLKVEHSFGNCPRYIQLRGLSVARDPTIPASDPPLYLDRFDDRARAMIAGADSFFVASFVDREDGHRQVDVSHRGGKPGFVRQDDNVLTIPDFAGNLFFNTLGNFVLNPKAGLAFVDFATGDLLQLTGEAAVILEAPEIAAFQGAERLWRFTARRIVHRPGALPIRWSFDENGASPASLLTGSWDEAERRLKAEALATAWRPFRIAKIVDESAVIRSFHLEPTDGAGLIPHLAGQHLPIRLPLPGCDKPTLRTYTLSAAPSDNLYRISVKREGRVSRHLHDALCEGDLIEARAPAGQFTIDAAERKRPAVLLAAGVGVTPMLAMLRHVVYEGRRKNRLRPTWFFHAARTKAERAFDQELNALVEAAQGAVRLVRVLSDPGGAEQGKDYDTAGRIDIPLLKATLPFDDYDFYLCGPGAFMQAIYDGLRDLNIADGRIHAEAFGPASLQRRGDASGATASGPSPATTPVRIVFTASGKEARWAPGSGTLLELAEARGLSPDFSCRAGNCGTCRTRVLKGAVAYDKPPAFAVPEGEALICCSVPAAADADEALQLDL